jgi:hypothetical protein
MRADGLKAGGKCLKDNTLTLTHTGALALYFQVHTHRADIFVESRLCLAYARG